MEWFLQRSQKIMDSVSKWNGSNGSSVNPRPIRTNFGSVLLDSSVNGAVIPTQKGSNFFWESSVDFGGSDFCFG